MTEFLESLVSEKTRRSYRFAIATFESWYKKSVGDLLKEEDPGKVLEKYWVWLKNNYSGNTPRGKFNPVIQYCKFNNVVPKIKKSLHVNKQIASTRDHVLTVLEARKMYEVASLEEKVMLKVWMLGLRVRDATLLEWRDFDFGEPTEELMEVRIITKKEETPAFLFIDREFQTLLQQYILTLDQSNKFLLQSNKGEGYSEKQLVRKLQTLRDRAGIKTNKVFGWHIARDLRLTTGTNLGLNHWCPKLMVGKSVGPSIWAYISPVDLRSQAEILSRALRMEPERTESNGRVNSLQDAMEMVFKALRKLIEREARYSAPSYSMGIAEQETDEEVVKKFVES